jgi:hypothetical protein
MHARTLPPSCVLSSTSAYQLPHIMETPCSYVVRCPSYTAAEQQPTWCGWIHLGSLPGIILPIISAYLHSHILSVHAIDETIFNLDCRDYSIR